MFFPLARHALVFLQQHIIALPLKFFITFLFNLFFFFKLKSYALPERLCKTCANTIKFTVAVNALAAFSHLPRWAKRWKQEYNFIHCEQILFFSCLIYKITSWTLNSFFTRSARSYFITFVCRLNFYTSILHSCQK